jgi:hypothetical protein
MKQNITYFILVISLLLSCTNTSEDDLIETTPIETLVTYNANVKSIIDSNCISCHSDPPENGAPMQLTTYDNLKEAIENRNLINRISSNDLSFVMPFGGPRLPQNLIDIVMQWETDGLLEE